MLLSTSSPYNHDIRVFGGFWGPKLFVNGSWQSGPYIKKLWVSAFKKFQINRFLNIQTILVLGIGGGTVIELLARQYPNATITAVDIDTTMIDIAKRYFHFDSIANLRVVCGDAKVFVRSCSRYDLVIVDLFIGPKIPEFVSSTPFLKNLHAIVEPGGHLVINYLRELEYQKKSDKLMLRLNALWGHVEDMNLYNNRFFFAGTRFVGASQGVTVQELAMSPPRRRGSRLKKYWIPAFAGMTNEATMLTRERLPQGSLTNAF